MLFVDHLGWSHHEQMVINCRLGAGVGHQEPSQTQNLINIQTTAATTGVTSFTWRVVNWKCIKRLELRMFWVHSNSVEPKVQHVLCHCMLYIFPRLSRFPGFLYSFLYTFLIRKFSRVKVKVGWNIKTQVKYRYSQKILKYCNEVYYFVTIHHWKLQVDLKEV